MAIGVIEGAILCVEMIKRNILIKKNNLLIDSLQKAGELREKVDKKPRREVEGAFKNPLQDGYRKNKKGLYTPVKPNSNPYAIRPNLGDDEEDEL